jgi:hypothetical protein
LFEVFETSGDAVRSFYRFLPNAMKNQPVFVPKVAHAIKDDDTSTHRAPFAA